MKTHSEHMAPAGTRIERDTMGELAVPADAYYGVQTARAIENFPISSTADATVCDSGPWV